MQGKDALHAVVVRYENPSVRCIQVLIVELLIDAGADVNGIDAVS